jgi:hypothetical protein
MISQDAKNVINFISALDAGLLIPRLAQSRGGRRRKSREVALSTALRDNSTCKLQRTLFLKLGSHY